MLDNTMDCGCGEWGYILWELHLGPDKMENARFWKKNVFLKKSDDFDSL